MSRKWWVLSAVACGTFMATLDASIVGIALPTLTKELVSNLARVKWVILAHLLTITCLLLPMGKLADIFGRKRAFILGFFVFTLGSVLCGVSPTLPALVISRVIQGVGSALLMANGPALIASVFPAQELGKAVGTLAMVVSFGLIAGPSVGGIIISEVGWRTVFLLNFPVGILGAVTISRFLEPDGPIKRNVTFDWAGALLQTILLLSFVFVFDPPELSLSGGQPFAVPRITVLLATFLLLAVFLKLESYMDFPLVDLGLMKIRVFATGNLAAFLNFVAYSAVTVLMPFYLEEILGFSTDRAGWFMSIIPVMILIVAPMSGRISDRLGSRWLGVFGTGLGALTLALMAGTGSNGLNQDTSLVNLGLFLALVGIGIGLFQSPNNSAMMGVVPQDKLGAASALIATIRNLGMVTGAGLSTAIFIWRIQLTGDFIAALHFTHGVAALIGLLAMVSAYLKGARRGLEEKGA